MENFRVKFNYIRDVMFYDKFNNSNDSEKEIFLLFREEPYFNELIVAFTDIEYCIPILDNIYFRYINV